MLYLVSGGMLASAVASGPHATFTHACHISYAFTFCPPAAICVPYPLAPLPPAPQDMAPYVPLLMPELQKALLDPLPEVRATAARAMGSLLKGMGAASLGDLLPWLLTTLRSEGSSVERSGAAQVGLGGAGGWKTGYAGAFGGVLCAWGARRRRDS